MNLKIKNVDYISQNSKIQKLFHDIASLFENVLFNRYVEFFFKEFQLKNVRN